MRNSAPRIRRIIQCLDEGNRQGDSASKKKSDNRPSLTCAYHIEDAFSLDDLEKLNELRHRIPLDVSRPTCPRRFLTEKPIHIDDENSRKQHREDGWVGALIDKTIDSWKLQQHSFQSLPWYRFLEYTEPGGHMDKHSDGSNLHPNTGAKSVATMLIYLSTCQSGGETTLYCRKKTKGATEDRVLERIRPLYNSVLIFPHAWQHSGDAVQTDPKIVLRVDLALRPTPAHLTTVPNTSNSSERRNRADPVSEVRTSYVRHCCSLVEDVLLEHHSAAKDETDSDWTAFQPPFLSLFQQWKPYSDCGEARQLIEWSLVPESLRPSSGELDTTRATNKERQVEAMLQRVVPLVDQLYRGRDQQPISVVEFGAGSGHLGLILAFLRPNECFVTLLERKAYVCQQANRRAEDAKLRNVTVVNQPIHTFSNIQQNHDVSSSFHMGISLHSCGVLTDAALALCLRHRAAFCFCPCCYGQTAANLPEDYLPRSQRLESVRKSVSPHSGPSFPDLTSKQRRLLRKLQKSKPFDIIARSADCTSAVDSCESFVSSTNFCMAKRCMQIVDADRLLWVSEHAYDIFMTSLQPLQVTPKNNIIMGSPRKLPSLGVFDVTEIPILASMAENQGAEAGERAAKALTVP